jgi:hypothetical protein
MLTDDVGEWVCAISRPGPHSVAPPAGGASSSRRAMSRNPSCLISWIQLEPDVVPALGAPLLVHHQQQILEIAESWRTMAAFEGKVRALSDPPSAGGKAGDIAHTDSVRGGGRPGFQHS